MSYTLSHLEQLESEAIHIFREVAEQFENPVLLFSGGKDSITMVHLAYKAFYPAKIPFPFLHVDTGHNFPEALDFRDNLVKKYNVRLDVGLVQDSINRGTAVEEKAVNPSRNQLQSITLLEKLEEGEYDAAFGGGRRDEEKARAKERFFSHRNDFGEWDPKNQRPELWNLYNGKKAMGESFRVFPISNWTELDIWQYLHSEQIPIVPLYFAAERKVVLRGGTMILVDDDRIQLESGEMPEVKKVRFRTLGCYPLTGAIESSAENLEEVIAETFNARSSERQGRLIDKDLQGSMEKKKLEGYF